MGRSGREVLHSDLGILVVADAGDGQLRAHQVAGCKNFVGHRNLAGDTGLKSLDYRRNLGTIALHHCTQRQHRIRCSTGPKSTY